MAEIIYAGEASRITFVTPEEDIAGTLISVFVTDEDPGNHGLWDSVRSFD